MSVQERVRMCRLIDRMENHKEYTKRLGLENKSRFHGSQLNNLMKRKEVVSNETINKE